jgi:CarboxypepD_reg-like domain
VKKTAFILLLLCVLSNYAYAQTANANKSDEPKLIQFSGLLLADMGGKLIPVPYASVFIPKKNRGTYSDSRGFFTMVIDKNDQVRFSSIAYQTITISVPDTLVDDRYSIVQLMSQDTINLPETVIFPWPSKDHFKIDFLKMDVTPELQRRAAENLANDYLAEAASNGNIVPFGGKESANSYLRRQSKEYTYIGQTPPMNIFSPMAWGKFFQAWKNGDYKKKKE